MQAQLNNYRQSPRKVRLVADLVKGKTVAEAITQLKFLPKRAAEPITKLLKSAVANSTSQTGPVTEENLLIKSIRVDNSTILKRFRPRARGSASRINKRTSKIQVILTPLIPNP